MARFILFVLVVAGLLPAPAAVPAPSETPAKVIVSGLTSTAIDIPVVKVGQEIPSTYAGDKIHNTSGFAFYVSEHYALKTDRGDDYARQMLEIAELAYPHWVALVGAAPPDPDRRMYFVCGSSSARMQEAMAGDVGAGASGFGGGITIWANRSAYNYPSGTLTYHQRALVIHENLHMLNMIVNGTAGTEGMTYSGESHVYDPAKRQLTVQVFDKPPINNWPEAGLNAMQGPGFVPLQKAVESLYEAGGGPGAVYTQFFLTDPDRYFKWCLWRDEYYSGRVGREPNARVMEEIFGPLDALNRDWQKWLKQRHTSFHHVDWGWEQDGNAVWAYGWPWDGRYWSQMDITYAPKESVEYDPLRMDYPAEPMPLTVGPVKRGVAEPSVGFLFDGSRSPGCWGGLGLGVDGRDMCQVTIAGNRILVIDGKGLGMTRQDIPLSEELKQSAGSNGRRYGVTVQIKSQALEVIVRAGKEGSLKEQKASAPVDKTQRERLLGLNMALIGKDGYPVITPFIDDGRKMPPDLTQPAAPNRWRFAGEPELQCLYRAAWRLKGSAPASMLKLKSDMLAAVDGKPDEQARAKLAFESRIPGIVGDIRSSVSSAQARDLALADLAGAACTLACRQGAQPSEILLEAGVRHTAAEPVDGTVRFSVSPSGAGVLPGSAHAFQLRALCQLVKVAVPCPVAANPPPPLTFTASFELRWRGETIPLNLTRVFSETSVPCWWTIGPFDNKGDGTVDTPQPVERDPVDTKKTYGGAGGRTIAWQKAERPAAARVTDEFVLDYASRYGGTNVSAYALVWVKSPRDTDAVLALGSDDGVVAWLNGERVHKNMVARGYASKQDRVPVHLKAGRNTLLVKVAQGDGGWALGAHVLHRNGDPINGITYTLDENK
jgi:hypothetical protein